MVPSADAYANRKCSKYGTHVTLSQHLLRWAFCLLFPAREGAKYCDVCLYVCQLACLENQMEELHQIFESYCLWSCLGLFWWRCDTSCTSGFVDDVMFCTMGHRVRRVFISGDSVSTEITALIPKTSKFTLCVVHRGEVCYLRLPYFSFFSLFFYFPAPCGSLSWFFVYVTIYHGFARYRCTCAHVSSEKSSMKSLE